jgi:hypothetical protein
MSRFLKGTLIAFAVVAIVFGLPLLAAPGRFLGLFGWAPVEPLICRMFGSALLGLAWASYRGMCSGSREGARSIIETGAIFCSLAAVGMIRNMLGAAWPLMVWIVLGIFLVFAALWIINWIKK